MTEESFKQHSIFEKLNQLDEALLVEDAREGFGNENYLFLQSVLLFIRDRLRLTIPTLIKESELVKLASEIESGTSQINAFFGSNNIGHLNNAINNLTSALTIVRNFPLLLPNGDFDFSRAVALFQSTIDDAYKALEAKNKELLKQLEATRMDLVEEERKLSQLQERISAKEKDIQDISRKYIEEFESIKTGNNTVFENEKKKFNEAFDLDRKTFQEQFDTDSANNKIVFEEQVKKIEAESKEAIKRLNNKLSEANKIVNIVGNVGVTGNYQNIANENKKSADNFRIIALVFMAIMSVLIICSIVELSSSEFNLYKSLVRILGAAVLTYPAIYASRESTKHRKLETQNRRIELELASIGPFIELLADDKKQAIKEELVKKYFGNHIHEETNDDENISLVGLEKILNLVSQLVKK